MLKILGIGLTAMAILLSPIQKKNLSGTNCQSEYSNLINECNQVVEDFNKCRRRLVKNIELNKKSVEILNEQEKRCNKKVFKYSAGTAILFLIFGLLL